MKEPEIWTPPKLVQWISADFNRRNLPPPHRQEAEQLVSHALNISRLEIYLQYDKPCTQQEQTLLRNLVIRRHKGEPLAYILGSCGFWSLNLQVGPGVLIPRQDTELLIETALNKIPNIHESRFNILELGTGSAAIPLALALEREGMFIMSIDISSQALYYASGNITQYKKQLKEKNNHICLIRGDCFNAVANRAIFDLIISNPPYIPLKEIDSLQLEVSQWEPREALNGGEKGFDFYKHLMNSAATCLKRDGFLIFEHGSEQKAAIQTIMKQSKALTFCDSLRDYNNHDRVLIYRRNHFQ